VRTQAACTSPVVTGTRTGRPGPRPFARTCSAEPERILGHRDEERALEAERNRDTGVEILRQGVDELNNLGTAAIPLDLPGWHFLTRPAEVALLYRAYIGAVDREALHRQRACTPPSRWAWSTSSTSNVR
jgi:hypothetical protein